MRLFAVSNGRYPTNPPEAYFRDRLQAEQWGAVRFGVHCFVEQDDLAAEALDAARREDLREMRVAAMDTKVAHDAKFPTVIVGDEAAE